MTGDNNDINPRLQLLSAYNIDPLPKDFHDEITLASSSPSRNFTLRSWSKKLNASTVIREYKAKGIIIIIIFLLSLIPLNMILL